jgi:protein SCO1/2
MRKSLTQSCLAAMLTLASVLQAGAAIAPAAYDSVAVVPPVEAAVPFDVFVTEESGHRVALRQLISKSTVLVFADYTCTTLCGPIVAFVAAALEQSGLRAGEQFQLLVVGLDPKDSAADAARMRREHFGGDVGLNRASSFVTADQLAVDRLTAALGYRYAYDREHDQFVHPGAAYVLRADGHVARVLTGVGLSGDDMRLALVEAGEGRIGTLGDQVRLLCSGFDPQHGAYNLSISRVLAATGLATILALGGLIGTLILVDRRRGAA